MTSHTPTPHGEDRGPTNAEIAAYLAGFAGRETTRRVLSSALTNAKTRSTLEALSRHERDFDATPAALPSRQADPAFAARAAKSRAALEAATAEVAAEIAASLPSAEVAVSVADPLVAAWSSLSEVVERVLRVGRQILTLPCLAPAAAASAPDLEIRRETVHTGEGVRIEFQQLPGAPPYRLRAVVDASPVTRDADGPVVTGPYNTASLALEDSGAGEGAASRRHILVIPLNAEGRGYSDFVVGDVNGLPSPVGVCRLVSATLSFSPA